jgi:hypothetical protein
MKATNFWDVAPCRLINLMEVLEMLAAANIRETSHTLSGITTTVIWMRNNTQFSNHLLMKQKTSTKFYPDFSISDMKYPDRHCQNVFRLFYIKLS